MLGSGEAAEVDDVRWAFWRTRSAEAHRPLPEDVGLPTASRPSAAPTEPDPGDDGDRRPGGPSARTSGATPTADPSTAYAAPLTDLAADVDRAPLAAAGDGVVDAVRGTSRAPAPADALRAPEAATTPDDGTLAVAATGALAARLPALSGVDGAVVFDEPADELLHAYAEVLAGRAQHRADVDRDDLLAVAHLAAAAATVDGAGDPALLRLAGVPADQQLRAAALLLAQTADDGGGAVERLAAEVRELFGPPG